MSWHFGQMKIRHLHTISAVPHTYVPLIMPTAMVIFWWLLYSRKFWRAKYLLLLPNKISFCRYNFCGQGSSHALHLLWTLKFHGINFSWPHPNPWNPQKFSMSKSMVFLTFLFRRFSVVSIRACSSIQVLAFSPDVYHEMILNQAVPHSVHDKYTY